MLREIKYFVFVSITLLFLFFTVRFYFSDTNEKNSYRAYNDIEKRIDIYSKNLPILDDDTKNIIEYVEESSTKKRKKFNFWKLLENNE
tara:strand:- start:226 stop:489 length:264 start_codon:yes stop_codon:yes gene_type:complete